MPKQLNVDLRFNADTSQARKQIQDLQTSLKGLGSMDSLLNFKGTDEQLKQALNTVSQLKIQLNDAFNTNTGKLDLTKFVSDMQKSGMSLEQYRQKLSSLGPEGTKAFNQLAKAVSNADIPIARTNKLLAEMGTVLKNTIKWQISSSAIHGFMGAIQQAYGYAQDLNESLTNIRIVTGQSTEQMATFAAQANQAARALSTTTTAYTDAALIFYQQGLDDQAVKERTDATIKMAQVTGDSAQEVSSYMTAIWNNFDNGSESLEHYADVITALGAATASSSAEISQGLEKFASIADTVGLSYEYATTALATVVAQTRQSADVVGTAFKTMFARIQDLELGKTLEDGVDLGQYSKALAKVGVDVMDANGQLRAMDDILDDIGQRWSELGEAERVALAQNVAGQRQYAQFMAIFENWDTFQENLSVANTANGTLQEQADIYAKSWEASQKRVKAAMEGIYQSIIDDDFFITLNDGLATGINGVNKLIKAFGGLPGILSAAGILITKFFGPQMAQEIRNITLSLKMLTPGGMQKIVNEKTNATQQQILGAQEEFKNSNNGFDQNKIEIYTQQKKAQEELIKNSSKMTEEERKRTDELGKQLQELEEQAIALQDIAKKEQQNTAKFKLEQQGKWANDLGISKTQLKDNEVYKELIEARNTYETDYMAFNKKASEFGASDIMSGELEALEVLDKRTTEYKLALEELADSYNITTDEVKELVVLNSKLADSETKLINAIEKTQTEEENEEQIKKRAVKETAEFTSRLEQEGAAANQASDAVRTHGTAAKNFAEETQNASLSVQDFGASIVKCAQGISTLTMVYSSLKGLHETWQDTDTSFNDKLLTTFMTLGMVIPMVASSFNTLREARLLDAIAAKKQVISDTLSVFAGEALENQARETAVKLLLLKLAKMANVEASEKMSLAEIVAAIKVKGLGNAVLAAAGKIAAGTGAILLLVAALGFLYEACKLAYEAYNADAIEAQQAQQAANNLANAYREVAQAYDEMKNTISNYESAKEALEQLTKGTQEYRDTLIEANNAAMALIENGNITSGNYHWEGDQLVIDEEAIEQAQAEAHATMLEAQATMRMGQISAQQASLNAELTRIRRSDNAWYDTDLTEAIAAVAIQAYGTAVGGITGGPAGAVSGFLTSRQIANANFDDYAIEEANQAAEIERLAQAYRSLGEGAFDGSELFENATEEMQDSIRNYCEQVAETANIVTAYSQDIAHANLDAEEYDEGAIDYAATQFMNSYEQEYQTRLQQTRERIEQISTEADKEAQDLWAEFQAASGINAQLVGVEGDDSNRNFTYYDENHELQHVYAQEIASTLATADALDVLGEAAERAQDFLNDLGDDERNFYEQALVNFSDGHVNASEFMGDFITLNNADIGTDNLTNYFNGENYDADALTQELNALYESLGLTTEQIEEFSETTGESVGDIQRDLVEGYNNSIEAYNTYIDSLSDSNKKFYQNQDLSELTYSQSRSIVDAYALAEENGANRIFERITSNMAPEVMAEFAETLEGVDWSSINSREFLQLLSDSGFEIEGFEDVLKEFCSSMRTVTAETLAASAEFFNGLQKIADGLSDQSDEISAEDFASLPEDMQQFFALTIDGTYKLLGAARDFQEYVEQSRIQEAIDNRNALYSQYDEARRGMSDTDYQKGAADDEYAQYLAADMAIALHYDDLSELQRAYAEGTVATVEAFNTAAYQIDQAQDTAMLDQEAWQEYSDYIREAGSALEGFNDEMNDLEADIVAKSIMKMNQAVETLSSNFDEWRDVLENSTEASAEYADALIGTRKAIAMLLDISEDYVSSDFVTEHLDLIAQAAEGDAEAIDQLRVELSQDVGSMLASAVSSTEADAAKIESWLNELTAQALAFDDLEVGASLYLDGKDGFVEALNEMIAATGMTVDQVNALCDSMGFEANFASEGQRIPTTIPEYTTHHEIIPKGGKSMNGSDVTEWDEITWTEQTGEHKAEGEAMAYAFTTDGTTPKINSITKKASGSANNSSSSNRGGSRSGGGGGGGKSGSEKKPKDPTGEIERYHVINNQIEDNEKALTRLSKAKDRAYGRARLNAMDAEIAKQRESVELAERKLQEVQKYLKLDSGAIAAFGAEFDANGTIVNYDQLMQQQIDKYNAAVEAYNNSSMDENAEAVFQQAEDDYNAFTEALKQYEETQDLWYEQAQAVADAKAEVLQLELEKTNYKVEIGIEWEEEDIARLDFMLKRIEDDAHKAAEAIGLLGEKTVDAMDKYNVYQQGFADTLRNLGVSNAEDVIARASAGEDLYGMIGNIVDPNQMAQAIDQMDDYISNMMSSLEQAQEAVDQAFEKVKNVFSDNVKKMDEYIDKIEFCQKITKSYMNIVDIVGKKSLGITNEMLRTFNAESVTQAINNEAAAKAKMDTIQAQLMESQARLAQASGEAEQKYWNEIIEEQEKELISATENFHQAWEDALQANLEAFENNIELVIEDFSNAVGDLNAMKAEWDLQKSLTDMWEPEYERWHQLSDLINDINKSVDENENLKYKQDLLDLEQEIAALQEEEAQLSEYDLNYLRLRYEAKLAEIALEEAQNAKSQVRMSRDNEGNYSYVYTADEDAVNNAADDYRNKIYEMEKANEEYIDTLQEQLLDMHDKMLEDIKEAGDLYGIGTKAYFEAVDRIEQTYLGQSQFIQAQMQNVFDNNQRLRDEDIIQYVAYTGDIAAQNVDLQLSFADTYMGIQTQSDNLNTYFNDTWIPALETTFDNAREVTDHYVETNEVAMETAGTTMDEFSARATQDMAMATAQTEELARQTKNYGDIAVRAFAQAAQAWQTGPGSMLNAIESQAQAIANLAQQYTSLKTQLDAATASAIALAQAMNQPVSSSPNTAGGAAANGGSGGGGGSSGGGNGGNVKDTLTSTPNTGTTKGVYGDKDTLKSAPSKAPVTNPNTPTSSKGTLKKILQFASGGYTGEWSDEPRWALLDQKELVLNTKDTMNLLSAVDVVRQLANSIDLNTMSANIAGASIKSASGTPGTIEQKVEITASFPNATDRNEIEQAFQNLVNHASQYANRKD